MHDDENGNMIAQAYIKLPSKDEIPIEDLEAHPNLISEMDLDFEPSMLLGMRKSQFKKTGNPVYLIEALIISHREKLFPQEWILNYLSEKFLEYHDSNGEKSLEKILGFSAGRGKDTAFKEVIKKDRDDMLMMEIWKLHYLTGESKTKCAHLVATRFNLENKKTTIIKIRLK